MITKTHVRVGLVVMLPTPVDASRQDGNAASSSTI